MERNEAADALEDSKRWFNVGILAGDHGDYNIGLYAMEMSIEIALKGVLTKLEIAYPKVHDILPFLIKAFAEKKGKLPKEFIENETLITDTFRELLKRRGPAGYSFSSNIKIVDLKGDFNAYSKAVEKVIKLCQEAVKN
ncbi:MAG: HEPN domain-containing protein [Candidatus Parvarchaeum sp.]